MEYIVFCRTCIYDDACIEDYSWINIFWRAYRSVLFGIMQGQEKTNWMMVIPLGIVYFIVYYFLFHFLILKFDIKTPGREEEPAQEYEEEPEYEYREDFQKNY